MVNLARPGAVTYLRRAKLFGHHSSPEAYGDEGLDDASADIMAFDFGAVRCRNELRYQKILKFSPWIVLAEKIRLVPQVGPLDLLVAS